MLEKQQGLCCQNAVQWQMRQALGKRGQILDGTYPTELILGVMERHWRIWSKSVISLTFEINRFGGSMEKVNESKNGSKMTTTVLR